MKLRVMDSLYVSMGRSSPNRTDCDGPPGVSRLGILATRNLGAILIIGGSDEIDVSIPYLFEVCEYLMLADGLDANELSISAGSS